MPLKKERQKEKRSNGENKDEIAAHSVVCCCCASSNWKMSAIEKRKMGNQRTMRHWTGKTQR